MTVADTAAPHGGEGLDAQLDLEGYAVLAQVLDDAQVRALTALCDAAGATQRVPLARRDLGQGELVFAAQDLPPFVAALQARCYEQLAPVANRWNAAAGRPHRHPATLNAFLDRQREQAWPGAASHFSVLRAGDYQALHQGGGGAQDFALQLVLLLGEPGEDFRGGEFVMTEQRPRMQSRPIVLPLRRGTVAVIAVGQRPHAGAKGHCPVHLRHAIGRVLSGRRVGLELFFEDAKPGARGV